MQPMRKPLLTPRLILRDITLADAELLFDLDSDPEVMRYIGPRPAPDVAGYRDRTRTVYLPQQAHAWHGVRIALDRASGDFLGWVFVRPATAYKYAREIGWTRPDDAEVGYRYRRCAWGAGSRQRPPLHLCKLLSRTRQRRPSSGVPGGQRGIPSGAGEARPGACRRGDAARHERADGEAGSLEVTRRQPRRLVSLIARPHFPFPSSPATAALPTSVGTWAPFASSTQPATAT